ncbi:hypothetical protein EG329_005415 [Mollisiaceae sp. DMI_Dod_QoI]|nr:hypothetical protein EG329_005415 [Helotiales sp. DMI_Dod_QoI]
MPNLFTNTTPLLAPIDDTHSLSERINIATRSLHTQLNRLILLRLPLAIPPTTTNPSKYVSGLLYIAPIYITFESLWQSIINSPCEVEEAQQSVNQSWDAKGPNSESKCDPDMSESGRLTPKTCSRIHYLLSDLQLPGLSRAERLEADIRALTGTPKHKVHEQLVAVSQHGKLAEFLAHIKKSVEANPHVLLAYAWVLYMALFSGGRHLRAELKKAGGIGPHFWEREPSPVRPYFITQTRSRRRESKSSFDFPETPVRPTRSRSLSDSMASHTVPGMRFFNFPGSEDGEDIKLQFKARYVEAETHLTESEKIDIITEAQYIFRFMVEMVHELDLIMQTPEEDLETEEWLQNHRPLTPRRDSVDVTHERLSRSRTIEKEEQKLQRKSTYLEVLVNQPIAKLVQFRGAFPTWDLVMKPLGRRFSKDGPSPQVSFKPGAEGNGQGTTNYLVEHYLAMLLIVVSALAGFLAWYFAA